MSKKYRYRNGESARILCIDGNNCKYPVVSMDKNGYLFTHTEEGLFAKQGRDHHYDLVEDMPYADFQIDDPVMVKDKYHIKWKKRYFAGVDDNGKPLTWNAGTTSWTAELKITWDECRRPTPEEME